MSILKNIFSVNRKTFLNPTAWLGVSGIAAQNNTLLGILKPMFSKQQPVAEETFDSALQRWELTDADLEAGITQYTRYALLFAICGLISLLYGFYLLFRYHTFAGWLLAMGMVGLFVSQAYKYDFWAMQMKRRTLGLSLDQYIEYRFGNNKG